MWVAILSSHRSKDPVKQVGACIVNSRKRVIWIWYNGFPAWCSDEEYPRGKHENIVDDKRTYVVHAEANAILNAYGNLENAIMYVVLFPCNECTKLIIQSWIRKIVYLSDEDAHKDHNKASKRMLQSAWVEIHHFKSDKNNIQISFDY